MQTANQPPAQNHRGSVIVFTTQRNMGLNGRLRWRICCHQILCNPARNRGGQIARYVLAGREPVNVTHESIKNYRQRGYVDPSHRQLLHIKALLGHNRFGRWINKEFDLSHRTAQNYMAVAKVLGEKSAMVAHLRPTTLYALAVISAQEPKAILGSKAQSLPGESLSKKIASPHRPPWLQSELILQERSHQTRQILAHFLPTKRSRHRGSLAKVRSCSKRRRAVTSLS